MRNPYLQEALRLLQAGRSQAAIPFLHSALEQPNPPLSSHLLLIQAYLLNQQSQQALQHLEQAILPAFAASAEILYWQGMVHERCQQAEAAQAAYAQALQADPQHLPSQLQRARLYTQSGQLPAAQASYQALLDADPEHWDAVLELAELHVTQAQPAAALKLYKRLARQFPQQPQWLHKALQQVMLLIPPEPENLRDGLATHYGHSPLWSSQVYVQLSQLYLSAGKLELARESLKLAAEQADCEAPFIYSFLSELLLFPIAPSQAAIAAWSQRAENALADARQRFEQAEALLQRQARPAPLAALLKPWEPLALMPYFNLNPKALRASYGQLFAELLPALSALAAEPEPRQGPRLGFVINSNDAVRCFFLELLKHWPAEAEVHVFYTSPADDLPDLSQLRPDFQHHLLTTDLEGAVQSVQQARCDLLFLTEIHTDRFLQSLLAARRLARVQVTSWLSSGTSGLKHVDYFISSQLLEPPGAEALYTEKLITLPDLPALLVAPERPTPHPVRSDYGLPDPGHLYLCPHILFKLHPDFDATLAGILAADPEAQLVFQARPPDPALKAHWLARFSAGLPAAHLQRVHFLPLMPHADFLALLSLADLMLDPFYFGGGTTSAEALALGLPVVTWPGERLHGRITFAYYQKMGLQDCVAQSPADYLALALKLAQDKAFNQSVREQIQARQGCLFGQLEAAQALADCLLGLL